MKEQKKFKIRKIFKSRVFFFVLGALLFGTIGVGASTLLSSSDVTYDNSSSSLSSTTVQDALDELYEKARGGTKVICDDDGNCTVTCQEGEPTIDNGHYSCTLTCNDGLSVFETTTGYKCMELNKGVSLGNYVSMTPKLSSYSTNSSYTGYDAEFINPSELNLWIIINKNEDGTVDMISKYVSSTTVTFKGQTGYNNYETYLNTIAKQYENSTYTNSARYFSSTDINSISNITGLKAYSVNSTSTAQRYWFANKSISADTYWNYGNVGFIDENGASGSSSIYGVCTASDYRKHCHGTQLSESYSSFALRPIVTLKSTAKISGGKGTISSPFTLSAS